MMQRRDFLALIPPLLASKAWAIPTTIRNFGWIPHNHNYVIKKIPRFQGLGKGRTVLLYKSLEIIRGTPFQAYQQKGPDCVAFGLGLALEILLSRQITHKMMAEQWTEKISTDAIYSGGRNIIAKEKLSSREWRNFKRGGGMHGQYAVEFAQKYGILFRRMYHGEKETYNLEKYDYRTWERRGLPDDLLLYAKEHQLLQFIPVHSWSECRDSVAAGWPILFCAKLGVNNSRRDKDGFIKPRGTWYHAWCIAAIDDTKRPGALLINSHGPDFGSGPKHYQQPDGSVWVDARYIDRHLKDFKDSYAVCLIQGHKKGKYQLC